MTEVLEVKPGELGNGRLATEVLTLLRDAFPEDGPDEGDYYRAVGAPEIAIILREGATAVGHLGLYTREVKIGKENFEIGMLGGIAVAQDRRRMGHGRALVRHAHEHLTKRRLPFSILFAYEPRIYEGSGYKLMQNATHFIEADGTPRTLVYRGSMYAELSHMRWPNELLDLQGHTV